MKTASNIPPKEELICDIAGEPVIVYHGTPSVFEEFSADYLNSVGFHFECQLQAEHRVGHLHSRRIIRCHLLIGQAMLDLRGCNDPGWENPAATLVGLTKCRFFTAVEQHAFGYPNDLFGAMRLRFSPDERRHGNARIADAIRKKGYDSIAYDNENEPRDGKARDAYCVLDSKQILVVGFEDLRNGS